MMHEAGPVIAQLYAGLSFMLFDKNAAFHLVIGVDDHPFMLAQS